MHSHTFFGIICSIVKIITNKYYTHNKIATSIINTINLIIVITYSENTIVAKFLHS